MRILAVYAAEKRLNARLRSFEVHIELYNFHDEFLSLKAQLLSEWSRSSHGGEFSIDGRLEETAIALQRTQEDERERRGNRHAAECGTGTWICYFRNFGGSTKMLAQTLWVKNDEVNQIRVQGCFTPNIIIGYEWRSHLSGLAFPCIPTLTEDWTF